MQIEDKRVRATVYFELTEPAKRLGTEEEGIMFTFHWEPTRSYSEDE